MFSKRFLFSWIFSSIFMFMLSYAWHGLFLNDYERLQFPQEIFLVFSGIVYLAIGFVIAKAIDASFLLKKIKRKPFVRGVIAGSICGMFLFVVANVIGVSFSAGFQIQSLLFDLTWQVIEETLGGCVVAIVHYTVFDPTAIIED